MQYSYTIHSKYAFTLLEIMLVVIIMSLLYSMAIPKFGGSKQSLSERSYADNIMHTIRMLKSKAILNNISIPMFVSNDGTLMYRVQKEEYVLKMPLRITMDPESVEFSPLGITLPFSIEFTGSKFNYSISCDTKAISMDIQDL